MYSLIPNIDVLESHLQNFADILEVCVSLCACVCVWFGGRVVCTAVVCCVRVCVVVFSPSSTLPVFALATLSRLFLTQTCVCACVCVVVRSLRLSVRLLSVSVSVSPSLSLSLSLPPSLTLCTGGRGCSL